MEGAPDNKEKSFTMLISQSASRYFNLKPKYIEAWGLIKLRTAIYMYMTVN